MHLSQQVLLFLRSEKPRTSKTYLLLLPSTQTSWHCTENWKFPLLYNMFQKLFSFTISIVVWFAFQYNRIRKYYIYIYIMCMWVHVPISWCISIQIQKCSHFRKKRTCELQKFRRWKLSASPFWHSFVASADLQSDTWSTEFEELCACPTLWRYQGALAMTTKQWYAARDMNRM